MEFLINERAVDARGFPAHLTLLDFLRSQGLTGTKEGCAEGECGACAVALVAGHGTGSTLRVVNSCLLFLPMLAGQEVYTVEGLARDGRLSEPQRGDCRARRIAVRLLYPGLCRQPVRRVPPAGPDGPCDPHAMGGNLCRCTGYRPLRDAALGLGMPPDDDFQRRLRRPAPPVGRVFAAARGVRVRASGESGRLPGAARGAATKRAWWRALPIWRWKPICAADRWPLLVSLEAVPELRGFRDADGEVEIGAGLTLSEIEAQWVDAPPVMHHWFELFASPLIRNRATLGGNLATASPVGDAAPAALGA